MSVIIKIDVMDGQSNCEVKLDCNSSVELLQTVHMLSQIQQELVESILKNEYGFKVIGSDRGI